MALRRFIAAATLTTAVLAAAAGPAVAEPASPGADPASRSAGCAYTSAQPTIQRGSTGDAVRQAQCLLGVTVDGVFGSETETAVVHVQSAFGLKVDGIVGPQTWAALYAL
ncbi:peptidoglycan-binding domain-containing protein [Nocardia sp. NBC_00508]|uniref:peptidoglycan-binding domain-containing protein n=1 Tax=Nocardia sp. NBC_00508 TaxID=2975992 RepID=UPI003FA5F9F1